MNNLDTGNNYESQQNTAEATVKSLDEIWKNKKAANKVLEENKKAENISKADDAKEIRKIEETINIETKGIKTFETSAAQEVQSTPLSEQPMDKLVQEISFSEKVLSFFSRNEEPKITANSNKKLTQDIADHGINMAYIDVA